MAKKDEMTAEQEADLVAARDANRIIAGESTKPMDNETASHQYQAGTNAVNTNVLSDHPNKDLGESILDKIETPENLAKKEVDPTAERQALAAKRSEIETELNARKQAEEDAAYIKKHEKEVK